MEEIRLTGRELIYYFAIANIVLGVLFGTIPLVAGLVSKNTRYGWLGLISSIIGGAVLGIFLSYPLALIFTWLAVRGPKQAESAVETPQSEAL